MRKSLVDAQVKLTVVALCPKVKARTLTQQEEAEWQVAKTHVMAVEPYGRLAARIAAAEA